MMTLLPHLLPLHPLRNPNNFGYDSDDGYDVKCKEKNRYVEFIPITKKAKHFFESINAPGNILVKHENEDIAVENLKLKGLNVKRR